MPGHVIAGLVALGKAIAASKTATLVAASIGTLAASAKVSAWQRAKAARRAQSALANRDPILRQTGGEPIARLVYGMARVTGYTFYLGSSFNKLRQFKALSMGPCEGLCDFGTRTATPVVILNGEETVPLVRTSNAAGDTLEPPAGNRYNGALKVWEFFKADGTQGANFRTPDPLANVDESEEEWSYDEEGPYHDDWRRGDSWHRTKAKGGTPAGDATQLTGFPAWTEDHRVEGYSWAGIEFTQKKLADGSLVYEQWPQAVEFVMLGRKIAPRGSATATWSNNAARVRYDYLRTVRGLTDAQIDAADYTAAVALCGQQLDARTAAQETLPAPYDRYTPTFARYTIDGEIALNEDPAEIEQQMDLCWAGEAYERGGVIHFAPGADATASRTVAADDLLVDVGAVTSPVTPLNQRDNAVQSRILQSGDHGLEPLDLPEYADAAAVARDGIKRVAEVEFRFVRDAVRAVWLQRVNLLRQRESDRKEVPLALDDGLEYLALRPGMAFNLSLPHHGATAERFLIEGVTFDPQELAVIVDAVEDHDDTFGVTDDSGTLRVALTPLPPLPERPFDTSYRPDPPPLAITDPRVFAERTESDAILNYVEASAPLGEALEVQAEYALTGVPVTDPAIAPSADGVAYRALRTRPFVLGGRFADYDVGTETQRTGIWLQYQYGPVINEIPRATQLARTAILGTGNPGQTFRRFGVYAATATGGNAGMIHMEFTDFGTTGGSSYALTAGQRGHWKILLRSRGGATFEIDMPAVAQAAGNPYIWPAPAGLFQYLTNIRRASSYIDMTLADDGLQGFVEKDQRAEPDTVRRLPAGWADGLILTPPVPANATVTLYGRRKYAFGRLGNEATLAVNVTGDLTPPATPAEAPEVIVEPRSVTLDWPDAQEPDFARYEVGIGDSADTLEVVADTEQSTWSSGPVYNPGQTYYAAYRVLDLRGNRSAWSPTATFDPGKDLIVTDELPETCIPGTTVIDDTGAIRTCNPAGNGWVFTGIQFPTTGATDGIGTDDRRVYAVELWPPPATLGNNGDGAYTQDGQFGVKDSDAWPSRPSRFGTADETFSIYVVKTDADLPEWPAIPAGMTLDVNTTHVRIALNNGFIYKWNPYTGNWDKAGEIFGAVTSFRGFPGFVVFSPPTRNANGLYTATADWPTVAGAASSHWRVSPATASKSSGMTTDTELEIDDLPASATTTLFVRFANAGGLLGPETSGSVTTGAATGLLASAPRSFADAVNASNGIITYTWQLPATNANLITHSILEMRQGGTLYRRFNVFGQDTVRFVTPAVPAGTYSATLVSHTPSGPGSPASIASVVVPTRVAAAFPPPRNFEFLTAPAPFGSDVHLNTDWDAPDGRVPADYQWWTPSVLALSQAGPDGPEIRVVTETRFSVALPTNNRSVHFAGLAARYANGNSAVVYAERNYNDRLDITGSTPAATLLTVTPSATTEGTMTVGFTVPARPSGSTWINAEVLVLSSTGDRLVLVDLVEIQAATTSPRAFTTVLTGVPTRIQHRVQVRLYSTIGRSPVLHQQYTLAPITLVSVPTPSGLGTSSKTATGITITGPGGFPSGVNAIEYYAANRATPATPLAGFPRTTATSQPFPLALTGFAANASIVWRARYRSGPSTAYVYGGYADVFFAFGTAVTPPPAAPASLTITVSSTAQGSVKMDCPDVPGATQYRFEYYRRPATGTGLGILQVGITVNASEHTFANVPRGSYNGACYAIGPGGQSTPATRRSFDVTLLATTPTAPPAPLQQTPLILINANVTPGTGMLLLTGAWGQVRYAATYLWDWRYDLTSAERTALRNANSNAPTRHILIRRGETSGFTAQVDETQLRPVEGRVYTLTIRPKAADGTIGPARSGLYQVKLPTLSQPGSGRTVTISDLSIDHDGVDVSYTRITGAPAVGRYVYRMRTETGTVDLAPQSGTHTGAARIRLTGLTHRTNYRFWLRGQVGTTGPGTLLPETMVAFTTGFLPVRGGTGGFSDALPVLRIWVNPNGVIKPPDYRGADGQECVLLNDGSSWIKKNGRWQPTVLPHDDA